MAVSKRPTERAHSKQFALRLDRLTGRRCRRHKGVNLLRGSGTQSGQSLRMSFVPKFAAIVFALVIFTCAGASASTQTSSQDATLGEILRRHADAIGGLEAIHNLRDFVIHLTYKEGAFTAASSLTQRRPFYRLVSVPDGPLTKDSILEGYDGSPWEYYGDPGIVVRTVASAGALGRRNAHQFDDPLVEPNLNGNLVRYIGERTINAQRVFVVRIRFGDGFEENLFVDKNTYLIDGEEQSLQFHAYGKNVRSYLRFDDYRPVGGVLRAFRSQQIEESTGRVLTESYTTSAQANINIPIETFAPPEYKRTPLQAMLEQLYEEREDPQAIIQTYRDLRPAIAGSGVSTMYEIGTIAYQCLKMGDTKSAVILAQANATDYPNDAYARFGLGRAYAASGSKTLAAREFKAALRIDPKYERASKALAELSQ